MNAGGVAQLASAPRRRAAGQRGRAGAHRLAQFSLELSILDRACGAPQISMIGLIRWDAVIQLFSIHAEKCLTVVTIRRRHPMMQDSVFPVVGMIAVCVEAGFVCRVALCCLLSI